LDQSVSKVIGIGVAIGIGIETVPSVLSEKMEDASTPIATPNDFSIGTVLSQMAYRP
jgi:hypothetical protein